MKIRQDISSEGDDLVLKLVEAASGKVLVTRRWEGAAKYVRAAGPQVRGMLTLMVPKSGLLDFRGVGRTDD